MQVEMPTEQQHPYPPFALGGLGHATLTFRSVARHHRAHPDGPQHFDRLNIRALSQLQRRMTQEDRLWIERLDAELSAMLWLDRRLDYPQYGTLLEQQRLVLQLRFAHLSALATEIDEEFHISERLEESRGWIQDRVMARIRLLLRDVREDELAQLTEGDERPICYCPLLKPIPRHEPEHDPVRLPCGHMFSRACIETALQVTSRRCPSCRADFGLLEAEAADIQQVDEEVDEMEEEESETPWWVTMLRTHDFWQR